MFNNPFKSMFNFGGRQVLVTPEVIRDTIIGYDDIKDFLSQYEISQSYMNILFLGPPATAKTIFLQYCEARFENPIYYDCTTSTGKGIINTIVQFRMEQKENSLLGGIRTSKQPLTLLLDEIEKTKPRTDLNMLLNLLEGKTITYTKFKFYVRLTIPQMRVFATANDISKLPKPLISRFYILELQEYDESQFIQIGRGLATKYLTATEDAAHNLGEEFATKMYTKGIRDVRQMINCFNVYDIFKGKRTVDQVLAFQSKYQVAQKMDPKKK